MTNDRILWEGSWHLLCHRAEVPGPGDFVRFDVLGQEVAAFNDGSSVVVFDNRCPHRGTRIYDGSAGKKPFVCPYHGWSYRNGRLFVPQKDTFASSDPTAAELARYQSAWIGDFLFVSKSPSHGIETQFEGVAETLETISTSIEQRLDFNAYMYECNWKISVENALDQYHVGLVHRDSLNRLQMKPAVDRYFGLNNISTADVGDDKLVRKLRSLGRFFDLRFRPEGYIALHLFPFTFITSSLGYSYSVQQFYPSAHPDRTHFNSRFYASRQNGKVSATALEGFFQSSIELNHRVFAEDAAICGRIPTDTWSCELPRFISQGEEKVGHFRRSLATLFPSGSE